MDNPVWNALSTGNKNIAEGTDEIVLIMKTVSAALHTTVFSYTQVGILPLNFLRRTELQIYYFPILPSTKPLLAYDDVTTRTSCYSVHFRFRFSLYHIASPSRIVKSIKLGSLIL